MGDNVGTRRAGLTPREAIFVDVVRDGLQRAHRAAGRVDRRYRGRLTVQPSLSTTYIRHHTNAGKDYDFDAADLALLPEVYFFIATVPFVASHSVEAIADVGDTVVDMVRSIERSIVEGGILLAVEELRAARRKDAAASPPPEDARL
jgi:hypothetical protein